MEDIKGINMKENEKVILFTTHCPKCNAIVKKLERAGIQYEVNEDIEEMRARGYTTAPMLDVDGTSYDFSQALKWLKEKEL
jgi:predicted DCC family thiol-disulfide oxidoreductase YuxK